MNEYQHDADNQDRVWTVIAVLALCLLVGPSALAMGVAGMAWVCGHAC